MGLQTFPVQTILALPAVISGHTPVAIIEIDGHHTTTGDMPEEAFTPQETVGATGTQSLYHRRQNEAAIGDGADSFSNSARRVMVNVPVNELFHACFHQHFR